MTWALSTKAAKPQKCNRFSGAAVGSTWDCAKGIRSQPCPRNLMVSSASVGKNAKCNLLATKQILISLRLECTGITALSKPS